MSTGNGGVQVRVRVTWIEASPELRNDLFGDEVEVVEIGQIKDLRVHTLRPASRYFAIAATTLVDRSGRTVSRGAPRVRGRSRRLVVETRLRSRRSGRRDRWTTPFPTGRGRWSHHASATRLELARHDVDRLEHHVELGGEAGRQCRRALLLAWPPMMIGGGDCTGLGARGAGRGVVLAAEGERRSRASTRAR